MLLLSHAKISKMRHFFNLSKEKKVWEILENTSKNTKINMLNSIFSNLYYS